MQGEAFLGLVWVSSSWTILIMDELHLALPQNERMTWLEEEVQRLKAEIVSLRSAGGASKVCHHDLEDLISQFL